MLKITTSFQAPDLNVEHLRCGIEVPTIRLQYFIEPVSDFGDLRYESGPLKLFSSSCRDYKVINQRGSRNLEGGGYIFCLVLSWYSHIAMQFQVNVRVACEEKVTTASHSLPNFLFIIMLLKRCRRNVFSLLRYCTLCATILYTCN
jgi:hypothetical protein